MDSSSYGTSALGALTVAVIGGIGWWLRNRCKHSRCALNSGCLKISSQDDERKSTIRAEVLEQLRKEGLLQPGVELPVLV
jgi:hypothetical protein